MKLRVLSVATLILLLVGTCLSQTTPSLRVGVVVGRSDRLWLVRTFNTVINTDRVQGARLADLLSTRKPVKPGDVPIEGLLLTSLSWKDALAEARSKGCNYVVVLDIAKTGSGDSVADDPRMEKILDSTGPAVLYTIVQVSSGAPLPGMPATGGAFMAKKRDLS